VFILITGSWLLWTQVMVDSSEVWCLKQKQLPGTSNPAPGSRAVAWRQICRCRCLPVATTQRAVLPCLALVLACLLWALGAF